MIFKHLLILALLLSSIALSAQIKQVKKMDTIKTPVIVQPQKSNGETEAYKMLYETAQKSYENERATTQWTIGIVIGFILLIFSSQYLINWKFNKQEIENIKNDLAVQFQNGLAELRVEFAKDNKESLVNIEAIHQQQLVTYQKLIDDFGEKFKEERTDLKENIKLITELNTEQIKSLKESLNKEVEQIDIHFDEIEANVWLLRGVEANAFRRFLTVAEYNIRNKPLLVKFTLQDIRDCLTQQESIDYQDFKRLKSLIKEIKLKYPNEHNLMIDKLEAAYGGKKLHVYRKDIGYIYVNEDGTEII